MAIRDESEGLGLAPKRNEHLEVTFSQCARTWGDEDVALLS